MLLKANIPDPSRRSRTVKALGDEVKVRALTTYEFMQAQALAYVGAPKQEPHQSGKVDAESVERFSKFEEFLYGFLSFAVVDGDDEPFWTAKQWKAHSSSKDGKEDVDRLYSEAKDLNEQFFGESIEKN